MKNTEFGSIEFYELDKNMQKHLRRLVDSFMLTAGGLRPLPDNDIKPVMNHINMGFLDLLINVIKCPKSEILKNVSTESNFDNSRLMLTLMIITSSTVMGKNEVRKLLMQALLELCNLHEMGDLFLDCARNKIRRQSV